MKRLDNKFRFKGYEWWSIPYGFWFFIEAWMKYQTFRAVNSLDIENIPGGLTIDGSGFMTILNIGFLIMDIILTTTRNDTRYVSWPMKIWLRCGSILIFILPQFITTWDWPIFTVPFIIFIRPFLNKYIVSRSIDIAEKKANGLL